MKQQAFNPRTLSMIGILILLWILFRVIVGEFYFSGESIAKLSRDMVSWTILAAGVTLVIVAGQIDLSIGSLLAVVAATCALLMNPEYGPGWSWTVAVPAAIVVGTLLGTLQGLLTALLGVPSFIVTLGGLFVFRGITQKVSEFDPRVPDTSGIVHLGFDYLSPLSGWVLGIAACLIFAGVMFAARRARRKAGLPVQRTWVFWLTVVVVCSTFLGFISKVNEYKGLPMQTFLMALVLVVLYFISRHTRFGRHLFAIGGNVEAARLSGINVKKHIVAAFALMGFLTGIAGVVWMAQNQGSTKNAGQFYELYAIAAAVIGGTSLMGGRGSIQGTFLGGLVMATVIQGMDYTNLENWLQLVVRGGVLVAAVGIDVATKKRR
jgi:D-xylose transport system permease protein